MMRYISPMRLALVLALLAATPLHAWEFSATPICTLTHATQDTIVRVTYDPRVPEYAIRLTRTAAAWPDAPVAYLGFSRSRPSYGTSVKRVIEEKWAFSEVEGAHFHMLVDPDRVAKALLQLAQKCGVELS